MFIKCIVILKYTKCTFIFLYQKYENSFKSEYIFSLKNFYIFLFSLFSSRIISIYHRSIVTFKVSRDAYTRYTGCELVKHSAERKTDVEFAAAIEFWKRARAYM